MKNHFLFTDAGLNPRRKAGVGGYLLVGESLIKSPSRLIKKSDLSKSLKLKQFEDTSSTTLEVQTVLWALEEYCTRSFFSKAGKLHIYSDSQCVNGLLPRRARLERDGYRSNRSRGGKRLLKNASLYKNYYEFYDRLTFDVIKVAGHTPSRSRNTVETIFSFIDQEVRKALKHWMARLEAKNIDWYVYIIRCRDGSLYTGISNDVSLRFEKHRQMGSRGAKYLRGRGPLELVFQQKTGSKSAALKMEQIIKKLSKSQKESLLKKEVDLVRFGVGMH